MQSLAASHHTVSVVQTRQSDLPAARYQHMTGLHSPDRDRWREQNSVYIDIYNVIQVSVNTLLVFTPLIETDEENTILCI